MKRRAKGDPFEKSVRKSIAVALTIGDSIMEKHPDASEVVVVLAAIHFAVVGARKFGLPRNVFDETVDMYWNMKSLQEEKESES